MSLFSNLTEAATDPIFGITALYNKDPSKEKINLIIGYYRDETLQTPILESIKLAEEQLLASEKNKEYLGIDGLLPYIEHIALLTFSPHFYNQNKEVISSLQSVGGTGALNTIADLLKECGGETIYISDPSWPNHRNIFERSHLKVKTYPYYNFQKNKLLFSEMCSFFEALSPGSPVVLHASCHNPSGSDLSMDEWELLEEIFKRKGLIPVFDIAYQGLGDGIDEDAASIRLFLEKGHELFVAYSCSKNFALYGERTGACFVVSSNKERKKVVDSRIKQIARATYSNPPRHGAILVNLVLSHPNLKHKWEKELSVMRERAKNIRLRIQNQIETLTGIEYSHVEKGKGLFFFTGLKEKEVQQLIDSESIYLTFDGRMNITGLNDHNFERVMNAVAKKISAKNL